jgi:hypothetical protein
MDLTKLTKLEEIHYPTEVIYFSQDGMKEGWVDVCEHCDTLDDKYGALWPCETMQDAYYEYEQDNA